MLDDADRISVVTTRPRFYAPGLDPSRAEVILSADESHHLVRVLRLVAGDEIAVFDGDGREFQARVARADRNGASVTIGAPIATAPDPTVLTTLVQAVLKGDKMDGVVRDATMAGVAQIVPVVTERSLVGRSVLKARTSDGRGLPSRQPSSVAVPGSPRSIRRCHYVSGSKHRSMVVVCFWRSHHPATTTFRLCVPVLLALFLHASRVLSARKVGGRPVSVKQRRRLDASSSAWDQ